MTSLVASYPPQSGEPWRVDEVSDASTPISRTVCCVRASRTRIVPPSMTRTVSRRGLVSTGLANRGLIFLGTAWMGAVVELQPAPRAGTRLRAENPYFARPNLADTPTRMPAGSDRRLDQGDPHVAAHQMRRHRSTIGFLMVRGRRESRR